MSRRPSYANVTATLALVAALSSPAWADPVAHSAASVASQVKSALKKSTSAQKRAKKAEANAKKAAASGLQAVTLAQQALDLAKNVQTGPKGEKGDKGEPGAPGDAKIKAALRSTSTGALTSFTQEANEAVLLIGSVTVNCASGPANVDLMLGGTTLDSGTLPGTSGRVNLLAGLRSEESSASRILSTTVTCNGQPPTSVSVAVDVISAKP